MDAELGTWNAAVAEWDAGLSANSEQGFGSGATRVTL
jgi:hypothetical protein